MDAISIEGDILIEDKQIEDKQIEDKQIEEEIYLDSVSEITLECFMNKDQYAKYMKSKKPNVMNKDKKDKLFYKKRIIDLSKQLLNDQPPDALISDVISSFDNYVKTCIHYFKVLDTTDIIQEEYKALDEDVFTDLDEDEDEDKDDDDDSNLEEIKTRRKIHIEENFMIQPVKAHYPSLFDNFVKVKKHTPSTKKKEFVPLQKDINLKDPILKNKGIGKKKNINEL